ncbi:MAG: hypothetical protein FWB98_06355 [Defluviitaleaceae bacterium]|nr:hypothetical protein [Defluviitaleaceae bacterium]
MKRFSLLLWLLIGAFAFIACGDDGYEYIGYSGYDEYEIYDDEYEYVDYEAYGEIPPSTGRIFMFGEIHGNQATMQRQLEIWGDFYRYQGMRHLFLELPYFATEFLNIWMQAEDDTILLELFEEWRGTAMHVPYTLDFYRAIKADFPETIFHGTDVGHASDRTGLRFLHHLRDNGLADSETYRITNENIAQFRHFQRTRDHTLRSSVYKPQNFIREFDRLGDQDIMAIHGAGHVHFGYFFGEVGRPALAYALQQRYGDNIEIFDMTHYALLTEPLRIAIVTVAGMDFTASYFGTARRSASVIGFWRLEDAYSYFADSPLTGDVLPFHNFPMPVEDGQVFFLDIRFTDGTTTRHYYRTSGEYWQSLPVAQEFLP